MASGGCTEASHTRSDSRALSSLSGQQVAPQSRSGTYTYADATHTLSHSPWGPLLHALACASAVHAAFPTLRRATGYEGEGIVSSHHCALVSLSTILFTDGAAEILNVLVRSEKTRSSWFLVA